MGWFLLRHETIFLFISHQYHLEKSMLMPFHVTDAMTDSNDTLTAYLAENPRMVGVLFTICLLLTQTGSAAAACGGTIR